MTASPYPPVRAAHRSSGPAGMETGTDNLTLTTPEVAELTGLTARQLGETGLGESSRPGLSRVPLVWSLTSVRHLQIAVALQSAVSCLYRGGTRASPLPALLEAVAEASEPTPPTWAVYCDGAVSYVNYPADLFRAVGTGAVVAEIKTLWPDTAITQGVNQCP